VKTKTFVIVLVVILGLATLIAVAHHRGGMGSQLMRTLHGQR
jgi:hypothetical protein